MATQRGTGAIDTPERFAEMKWKSLPSELRYAAEQAAAVINTHLAVNVFADIQFKYVAVSLQDGKSDGVLYDTFKDAVKHQLHYSQCAYINFMNLANGASKQEMALVIEFNRKVYKAGHRLPDPDDVHGGRHAIMDSSHSDYLRDKMLKVKPADVIKVVEGFKKHG